MLHDSPRLTFDSCGYSYEIASGVDRQPIYTVVNAVMIKSQLGEPIPGQYSAEFVNAYPHLSGVVQPYTEPWTLQPSPVNR